MNKAIIILVFIIVPLIAMASSSFLGIQGSSTMDTQQLQLDRSYRIEQIYQQAWHYVNLDWTNWDRFDYHYASSNPNHPDSITIMGWDSTDNLYERHGAYTITYNPGGELVSNITVNNNYYGMHMKTDYTYNTQGYLTGYLISEYNWNTSNYDPYSRMIIQYVSDSNYQIWTWNLYNIDLEPQWDHRTFQWDSVGRITVETNQSSLDSLNWVNSEQVTHEYHANDTMTGSIFVYNLAHKLPLAMTTAFSSPSYGMQTLQTNTKWANNQWVNNHKHNYTYNTNNLIVNETDLKWQSAQWKNDIKYDYTYDTQNNCSEIIKSIWSSSNSNWINDGRFTYNWMDPTANNDELAPPQILKLQTYPNPFRSSFSCEISSKSSAPVDIALYNLKGELLKKNIAQSNSNHSLDCSDLPSGIYFLKATQNGVSGTLKVLKVK